jgi:hypothetical protein
MLLPTSWLKNQHWTKTHKYGMELPKLVAAALAIDLKTGTEFWKKAIENKMKNAMPAFVFRIPIIQ